MYHTLIHFSLYTMCPKSSRTVSWNIAIGLIISVALPCFTLNSDGNPVKLFRSMRRWQNQLGALGKQDEGQLVKNGCNAWSQNHSRVVYFQWNSYEMCVEICCHKYPNIMVLFKNILYELVHQFHDELGGWWAVKWETQSSHTRFCQWCPAVNIMIASEKCAALTNGSITWIHM